MLLSPPFPAFAHESGAGQCLLHTFIRRGRKQSALIF